MYRIFPERYILLEGSMLWQDAQDSCLDLGRTLIEPRNQEQFEIAERFINENENVQALWLGSNDALNEGTWLWESDRSLVNLTQFWDTGRPSVNVNRNWLRLYNGVFRDTYGTYEGHAVCTL